MPHRGISISLPQTVPARDQMGSASGNVFDVDEGLVVGRAPFDVGADVGRNVGRDVDRDVVGRDVGDDFMS